MQPALESVIFFLRHNLNFQTIKPIKIVYNSLEKSKLEFLLCMEFAGGIMPITVNLTIIHTFAPICFPYSAYYRPNKTNKAEYMSRNA